MLRLLPPMFKPVIQQIRLLTGLNMGGKMRNVTIQLVLHAAMLQNKLHVFCCPFFRTFNQVLFIDIILLLFLHYVSSTGARMALNMLGYSIKYVALQDLI